MKILKHLTLSLLLVLTLTIFAHAEIKQAKCFADIAQEFTKNSNIARKTEYLYIKSPPNNWMET